MTPGLNIILREGFLSETLAYCAASGAADRRSVDQFIRAMKMASLWDSLVECWLLRSAQNAGTGSTAYGLKGTSGTLVNSPAWGATGINFSSNTMRMTTGVKLPLSPCSVIAVMKPGDTQNNQTCIMTGGVNVSGNQFTLGRTGTTNWDISAWGNAWPPATRIAQRNGIGSFSTSAFSFVSATMETSTAGRCSVDGSFNTVPKVTAGSNTFDDSPAPINTNITGTDNLPVVPIFATFNKALTDAEVEAFRFFYKNTLGGGLELP